MNAPANSSLTEQEITNGLRKTLGFLNTAWKNGFEGADDIQDTNSAKRPSPDDEDTTAPTLKRSKPSSLAPPREFLDDNSRSMITTTAAADAETFQLKRSLWPPHPPIEQTDDWWTREVRDLYVQILDFAEKHYCQFSIVASKSSAPKSAVSEWMSANTSIELERYISMVAEADPTDGGWEALLTDKAQRKYLIVGILARVLEAKVWAELLFGADDEQQEFLGELEKKFAESEGYDRTTLRSEAVRTLLEDRATTPLFSPCVQNLTYQIFALLLPFDTSQRVHRNKLLLDEEVCLQDIYDIVGKAAYLSIAMRVSKTIVFIRAETPGDAYDEDDQFNIDHEVYLNSKEKIAKNQARRRKLAVKEGKIYGEKFFKPAIKIVVWPSFKRFTPGNGKEGGERSGFRVYNVSKSGVVYYWAEEEKADRDDTAFGRHVGRDQNGVEKWFTRTLSSFWLSFPGL